MWSKFLFLLTYYSEGFNSGRLPKNVFDDLTNESRDNIIESFNFIP